MHQKTQIRMVLVHLETITVFQNEETSFFFPRNTMQPISCLKQLCKMFYKGAAVLCSCISLLPSLSLFQGALPIFLRHFKTFFYFSDLILLFGDDIYTTLILKIDYLKNVKSFSRNLRF